MEGNFEGFPVLTPSDRENRMPDGPLFGNGDIGVVAGGKDMELTFWISKNDFWHATYLHDEETVGGVKCFGYFRICSRLLRGASFRARQKLGTADVVIDLEAKEAHLQVNAYAPYQQNLILCQLEAVRGNIPLRILFSPLADGFADSSQKKMGNLIRVLKDYVQDVEWETKAAAFLRVIDWNGTEGILRQGEKVTVAVSLVTSHDTASYLEQAQQAVETLTDQKLKQIRHEHLEWWNSFWNTSGVEIPTEPEVEKYWYASHYLMACCSKAGKFAPGIFGNWINTDRPLWAGDYHLNYNYQAPWWGVYSSNKVSLSDPYDQPLLDYIPQAQENAKAQLGVRGIYSKVGIGPKGYEASRMYRKNDTESLTTPYWGQKSNAAYGAVNMLMRFYSTWDETYAVRILPYLRQAAEFWEDYLVFENGRYVIYRDCIHENAVEGKGIFPWDLENVPDYSGDFNPILTLGLLRMVFRGILDISGFLGTDTEHQEKWEHILTHLSDFPTQIREGKKVFRYTEKGMDWSDSNSLGIQHVYPCGTIGLSSEETLLETAYNTVEVMGRWSDFNAFPTFFTAAARVGYDPQMILERMKEQFLKYSFPNFIIYFGGGGIECCSTVPGCVNEMLFQSHEGILRFFPVWDQSKDARFERLRGYGAFIVSAGLESGKVKGIEIVSEKGRECCVLCPFEGGMTVTANGAEIVCRTEKVRDGIVYRFATEAGVQYRIEEKI